MPVNQEPAAGIETAQEKCNEFNEIPEGSTFKYFPFRNSKHVKIRKTWDYAITNGQAYVSDDGRAVVSIKSHVYYVFIENLVLVK